MINDDELRIVATLAKRQVEIEREIVATELRLEKLKKALFRVQCIDLPSALAEFSLDEIKLTEGAFIVVKKHYFASIPKEKEAEAFSWLEKHSLDSVIKNVVKCEFGKGENDKATLAMEQLSELGFQPEQKRAVHPMTLKSVVKDLFERGVEFPIPVFGAGVVNKATVQLPK